MDEELKPNELLVSYAVRPDNEAYVDQRVEAAIKDGYQIVDIISTPANAHVAVTVFLRLYNNMGSYYVKVPH